jgi:putative nucleotidyltransferase with HDIG domain
VVSVLIPLVAFLRHRGPINRLVFNIANHLLASLLCLLPLQLTGATLLAWPLGAQVAYVMTAAAIMYLTTTGLVAGAISLSQGRPFPAVWGERFRWLGVHYLALGLVAYVLLFAYVSLGIFSVLLLLIPLAMIHLSQRQYIKATKDMVDQLRITNSELVQKSDQIHHLNEELLHAVAATIDLRDPYVVEHSRHVARYAALTAAELGLPPAAVELVYQAGLMHDIGKLAIPEAILFKPGRLTDEEYAVIKDHVVIGADLLNDFRSLQRIALYVRHHHEHYDGRGYPDGLTGETIPVEARILALADAVEAMASDRPYRKGSSPGAILAEVESQSGKQFDPQVVDAFGRLVRTKGESIITNSARDLVEHDSHSDSVRSESLFWGNSANGAIPQANQA